MTSFRFASPNLLVRRVHLFLGLFFLPWVLLFGVTGLLFNHPGLGSDFEREHFDKTTLANAGLVKWKDATVVARELESAFVKLGNEEGAPTWKIENAHYEDDVRLRFQANNSDHFITLDVDGEWGTHSTRGRRSPAYESEYRLMDESAPRLRSTPESKKALAQLLHLEPDNIRKLEWTSGPRLRATLVDGGKSYDLRYDLGSGKLALSPNGESVDSPREVRSSLTRLHTLAAYPASVGGRWFWALLVDGVALSLVLWVLTGLFMSWQIIKLRRVALIAIASGIVTSVGLALVVLQIV